MSAGSVVAFPVYLRLRASGKTSAQQVLSEYRRTSGGRKSWRVPVEDIARWLGAELWTTTKDSDPPSWSGYLEGDSSPPRLWTNGHEGWTRQRFTVAHQIGHLMLHTHGRRYRDDSYPKVGAAVEMDANRYAEGLLLPADEILSRAYETRFHVPTLAKDFGIAQDAIVYRLMGLRVYG